MAGLWVEREEGPGRSRILADDVELGDETDDQTREEPEEPILCRRCGQLISDQKALFTIDSDRMTRVFANPHGFLHEVITVRWATGIAVMGPATTDFSWFPGYAWEIAHCARCQTHLGWAFSAVQEDIEPRLFWGLRRNQISGA